MASRSDGDQFTFASQAHVRNACDACHKRKIRCIASRNGGPCHNCQSRGLPCFFLPRYKSGRPRMHRNYPSEDTIIGSTTTMSMPMETPTNNASPISPAHDEILGRKLPRAIARSNKDDPFSWNWSWRYGLPGSPQVQTQNYPGIDAGFPDMQPGQSIESTFLDFAGPSHRTSDIQQPGEFPDAQTPTWSTTSQHDSFGSGIQYEISKEKDFSNLLEHCRRLQRHLTRMADICPTQSDCGSLSPEEKPKVSDSELHEMLEDIDTSCKLMFDMCDDKKPSKPVPDLAKTTLDPASSSLISAIAFKVFQICDVLFHNQASKNQLMRDILLQKRLDFNITQARIVMERIEQLTERGLLVSRELSKKAVNTEKLFK
ncbi:uncharacterized protein K452DRAFT_219698 [Aplosporella prunicola CBS 121167]|uniref:Zn(2)-C6 fungal-type domain-containing protein n=1 Tax=Aplosporella prunicola CBS 121167 TaxID=1176127 RepID=A0A6A6BUS3_9PEZI|nr:uncharacterized protein K452DRAFT_219698 [Aplosporella prunicola CBS 121167]KAF2146411.1 hypothetical protein K452DRAFT_219698 [Aplosporella prunicola CBS 121167]